MALKLTIKPTNEIRQVKGAPFRIWEGVDEAGIVVECWIHVVEPQSLDQGVIDRYAAELDRIY